jgi:hypothetical protein
MKVQSLPNFIDCDTMLFIKDYDLDDIKKIETLSATGIIEDTQLLGNGKVLWFRDKSHALMFMLGGRG